MTPNIFAETLVLVSLMLIYFVVSHFSMEYACKLLKVNRSNENLFFKLFYNSLAFAILIVTLCAIISTKGKTIFILILPIAFIAYRCYSKKQSPVIIDNSGGIRKRLFFIIIPVITIATVVLSYYFALKFSMRNDVAHYSKTAECLINQGIENPYHHYNNENSILKGNLPYHYFEMWFGSAFFKLNNILSISLFSNYIFYIFFVFNLFRVIAIIGIFGLINKYIKFNFIYFVVVFLILIIDISAYCNWWNDAYVAESNFFERPNFIFYYLFFIPIFSSILNNDRVKLALWSCVFIIATITALPSVSGAMVLILIWSWYKIKSERPSNLKILLSYLAFILVIAVFYKIFGASKEAVHVESMSIKQMITKTLSLWKACVFMFTMLSVKIAVFCILIFALLWGRLSKSYTFNTLFKQLLFYCALLCLTGIGVFQLIPYLDNMYQFAFVGYCAVVLMLIIVLTIKLSVLPVIKKSVFVIIFLLAIVFGIKRNLFFDHILLADVNWGTNLKTNFMLQSDFSPKYIKALDENARLLENRNGASVIDEHDVLSDFAGLRHSATYQLGNYFAVFNNNVNLPLVSNPDGLYPDEDKSDKNKDFTKAFTFNTKTRFYKLYDKTKTYKENLSLYLKQNKIKYVFASKSVNPVLYFDTLSIINVIKDSNKGHQLIILND